MNTSVFEPVEGEKISENQIPNLTLLYGSRIIKFPDSLLQENMRQCLVMIQMRMNRGDMNRALSAIHNLPLFFPAEGDMPNNGYDECKRLYYDLLSEYDRLEQKLFPSQFKSKLQGPIAGKVESLIGSLEMKCPK